MFANTNGNWDGSIGNQTFFFKYAYIFISYSILLLIPSYYLIAEETLRQQNSSNTKKHTHINFNY